MTGLRKDLRAITADGAACGVMVGLGETYLPAFVLALTASQIASGLIATFPMFVGALFQVISPYVVRSWRSYRLWVVVCALVQATVFVPLIVAAWSGALSSLAIFVIASVYWGTGMAGGSSWNTWVGPLVPTPIRARYFARRTLLGQLAQVLAFVAGGVLLQWSAARGEALRPFTVVFLVAAASRYLSALLLQWTSEPRPPQDDLATLQIGALWRQVCQQGNGRTLIYMLAVQSSVQVAAPYFTPYMLRHLQLSYWEYVELTCAAYVAKIVCLPWLGRMMDRWGARRMLWICGLGVSPVPVLWLVSNAFPYLLGAQFLSGATWAGYELAMLLLWFGAIPRQQRVAILTMYNLANATAVLIGSLAGGALLSAMHSSMPAYWVVFAISSTARFAALGLLLPLPWRRPAPVPSGPLVVRPALQRRPATRDTTVQGPHWGRLEAEEESDLESWRVGGLEMGRRTPGGGSGESEVG